MAQRKGSSPAPVKQKLRKKHGPKRKLFHDWDQTTRMALAKAGLLDKYHNYESFALSCAARGVKTGVSEMWLEFRTLPLADQKAYLADIKNHALDAVKAADARKKSAKVK